MKFVSQINKDGNGLSFGGPIARAKFQEWAKDNIGRKVILTPILPESRKMRGFYEGGVVGLLTYYQEGMDHNNPEDRRMVREWLKGEFNSEMRVIAGKARKVPMSTSNKLPELIERVLEWGSEQGYKMELLDPEDYKHWRDCIYSAGGPESYIDYLISVGKLSPK